MPLDQVWPDSIAALRRGRHPGGGGGGLPRPSPPRHRAARARRGRVQGVRPSRRGGGGPPDRRRARGGRSRRSEGLRTFVAPGLGLQRGRPGRGRRAGAFPASPAASRGELYSPGLISETLKGGLGISGLDYGPLPRLAALGLPPTLVLHGTMIDARTGRSASRKDLPTALRLYLRRDLSRLPAVSGLQWVGAAGLRRGAGRSSRPMASRAGEVTAAPREPGRRVRERARRAEVVSGSR